MDVNLEGPKEGEVLWKLRPLICYTDEFTLSGADPEGLFPRDMKAQVSLSKSVQVSKT